MFVKWREKSPLYSLREANEFFPRNDKLSKGTRSRDWNEICRLSPVLVFHILFDWPCFLPVKSDETVAASGLWRRGCGQKVRQVLLTFTRRWKRTVARRSLHFNSAACRLRLRPQFRDVAHRQGANKHLLPSVSARCRRPMGFHADAL